MTRPTTSSPSPSERWLLIGDPRGPRTRAFADALPPSDSLEVLGYDELPSGLPHYGTGAGLTVRIDSPGRCPEVPDAAWYRRLSERLTAVADRLREARFTSSPHEALLCFDKPRCQQFLADRGVPTPPQLGVIEGYRHLLALMESNKRTRVFVKLAHGSSAAGVVAYRIHGDRHQAFTTVAAVDRLRLDNTRRIRTLTDPTRIASLIDGLARHRAFAEVWVPKRTLRGGPSDVRVLVVDGEPAHAVTRIARSPITNLHLGAVRQPADARTRDAVDDVARRVAACFPASLHVGVDIALTPRLTPYVLEVNAFGDQLEGITHRGQTTYERQIEAWRSRQPLEGIAFDLDGTLFDRAALPADRRLALAQLRGCPDVTQLVDELRERHRLAVVTDGAGSTQRAKLRRLGLRFDSVVVSGELGRRKPDRSLFARAMRELATTPARTLMVGDDYERDIVPARAMGMRTLWVRSPDELGRLRELVR